MLQRLPGLDDVSPKSRESQQKRSVSSLPRPDLPVGAELERWEEKSTLSDPEV